MSKRTQSSHENAQPEKKFQTLNKEQAQTLLEEARGHPLETWVTLALLTGMRRGELIALQWQDINLDEHTLQVDGRQDVVQSKQ